MNDRPFAREPSSLSWQSLARIGRLVRKELTEILRDRRTILTLVLMPLLLYPLMTLAFQQYLVGLQVRNDFDLGFTSEKEAGRFSYLMDLEIDQDKKLKQKEGPAEKSESAGKKTSKTPARFRVFLDEDLDKIVREAQVDLGIRLKNAEEVLSGVTPILDVEIIYQPESSSALAALSALERALAARNAIALEKYVKRSAAYRKSVRDKSLARLAVFSIGLMSDAQGNGPLLGGFRILMYRPPPDSSPPQPAIRLHRAPLEEDPKAGKMISLAGLIPFILILMTITGAVYPAIDLTAGERERGTLEILVAAPVPRLGLLFAKYVAVLSVAILTALINLSAMYVTLKLSGWGELLLGDGDIPVTLVLALLGLLVLFAAFFSAVLLILTSFARSFKEAQAYLIPLMLASLGPGLAGMIPGLTLDGTLAVTPLVNIVLLARDVFEGGATPLAITLVITSTLLYALAAIAVAARIFGAEEVLYSDQNGWADFLSRPRRTQPTATLSNALVCLALMVPLSFLLRGLFLKLGEPTAEGMLIFMSTYSLLLFVLLPGVAAFWGRIDWREGFSLNRPPWLTMAGAVMLGFTLWPMVVQLMYWLHVDTHKEPSEQEAQLLLLMKSAGAWLAIPFGLAALTEELFFRGYLFAALRTARPVVVIVVTGVLFGVMHSVIGGSIGAKQLLPATLLGLILGWIRWRSGSVLPGIALHLVHNVILTLLLSSVDESANDQVPPVWLIADMLGLPAAEFLTAIVLGILGGVFLVYWGGKRDKVTR